jgi:hypothetical protein
MKYKFAKTEWIGHEHALQALTVYLRSLSMIDDDQEVTEFNPQSDPVTQDYGLLLIVKEVSE